jgi:hypothetical protein
MFKFPIFPMLAKCPVHYNILHFTIRLRVFENRFLTRSFGPKREEVVGGWRRLHNEELHNLYASRNTVLLG